ncbi:hypothetical protein QYE76_025424 [Lolium multiflorum]|uniref:Uncharacterized protein n=1 Tax=Lolium multiflorum TaxID=4521 RepID=A0AAD8VU89_LOLMU|nr:hypothetical protein QYE76_025424 [Lolium multiflorum]
MTESPRGPSGCAMFGMFRRRRSASMTSLSRINGPPQVAADKDVGALPAPVNSAKAGAHDGSSIVPRPKVMPLQAQTNGAAPHAPRPSSDKTKPARATNGVAKTAAAAPSPAVEYTGMAAELDKMIHDHQRVKGTTQMMRATSGNMMMHRNLGNLNAAGGGGASARSSLERGGGNPKPAPASNGYAFSGLGNIVAGKPQAGGDPLCRALSHRTDPEKLKELGNEEFREGHYAEAVALYDQAIIMDPTRPAYWGNKAAALAALGRLIEAVADCREAVRIDPSYARAHHRLGGLYLRLGEPDKAINYMKQSSRDSTSADVSRAQTVKSRIAKCNDARKLKDWITVLRESQAAVADGADSAPQVMALQAEAMLKLQRHDEADATLRGAPRFGVDESAKLFGTTAHAYVLMVRAQVDMAAGRLEEAVATAQTACQLDPASREAAAVHRHAKLVASARLRGNDLFRASRYAEACAAYGEGLGGGGEAGSAVLLCNRAACHAKLGRHEKAVEDCTGALAVRPGYSKARLRRADSNVKLERWEASLRDYQVLIQELPENEDVKKALAQVEAKIKSQRN